jgi:hypothetical protein
VTEMVRTGACAFAAGTRRSTARTQATADRPAISAHYPPGRRYRELAEAGVQTAIVGLSDAEGAESVRRFGEVIAAFRAEEGGA